MRGWGAWVEGIITAFTSNGGLVYSSKAAMDADLAHAANSMAWVIGDPVSANNRVYGKVGASGSGSWARRADLPFSFIIASDAGVGTANAIQATTSIPVSASALVWMNIFEVNTASPVTVSFNGASALTIKTNTGNDVAAGGLTAGMIVLGIVSGTKFRLLNDQVSTAIVAAAEAAQVAAEAAQSAAEAAAAGVSLPPVAPNRMLVDNGAGTARESKTFTQVRDLLDPLLGFHGNGSTDDSANFATLEATVTGQKIDGRGKRYRVTGAIPSKNEYTNGLWTILNYEGDLTLDIPFDFATLPVFKTTLFSAPGHNSWPEDNGWYWEGRKGVFFKSSNHQTGDRFVGFTASGAIDHWKKPVPAFGRDQNDAPNGFYIGGGGCVIRGVEFALMRRQAAGGGYPTDHRIYARNLSRWIEAVNVITPRNGLTSFRINKADLPDVEILEGAKATITAASSVGGQSVNGTYTCTVNNGTFMEFCAVGGNFSSATKGGGFSVIKIAETHWSHRTFAAGVSLGAQLVVNGDDGLLTSQPAVCLTLAPIPSDLTGAAYLSAGGAYGLYVVKVTGLRAGASECLLTFVKKQSSWAAYGEPTIKVSPSNESIVYCGLRSDNPAVAPAVAITSDAFATSPSPKKITPVGGWALDNPLPICVQTGVDGEEYVFIGSTGNRGGADTPQDWDSVPVYLTYSTKTSLLTASPTFRTLKVGDVNWYDMWGDTGPSGRSGVGVGTMIALPSGKVEYICGDMQPNGNWDKPLCNIVSFTVDISRIVGGEKPKIGQTVEASSSAYIEWTGLSVDVTAGNTFVPVNYGVETFADGLSVSGVFAAPVTGFYRSSGTFMINGNGLEQSAVIYDDDTGTYLALPAFSGDLNAQFALFRATLPTGTNMSVSGSVTVYLLAGQNVKIVAGPNTTFKATTIQNMIRWELIG